MEGLWLITNILNHTELQNTEKSIDVVGVDLGVKSLAMLSTGEVFEGAKSYRKFEAKLTLVAILKQT